MKNIGKIKYSVVVPIYNTEKYLRECIDSILNQSYRNLELVLVDDGSTDASPQICDEYAKKDSRVKVLHQKNQGHTAARMNGALSASGEYIICIDSDDYVYSNLLETIESELKIRDYDIVCYTFFRELSNSKISNAPAGEYVGEDIKLLQKTFFDMNVNRLNPLIFTKAIKKDLFIDSLSQIPQNIIIGEDVLLNMYLLMGKCQSIKVIDFVGGFHRNNDNSLMRKAPQKNASLYEVYKIAVRTWPYQEQIGLFFLISFNLSIRQCALSAGNIKEYRKLISEEKKVFTKEFINRIDVRGSSVERKIEYFSYKHGLWGLLYYLWRIKNRND